MILSRRSLLASFGVALPAVAVATATAAQAATPLPHTSHHAKKHVHAASAHATRHRKTHHTAATPTSPQA